ncbi:hypothetical protein [Erythrobacter sp. THAF29]|uniref:hypothetical protein n=1 Tax=Erythrobacter sp. THAF29 TaxID=2587851 RepID=UPI0012682CED|nr:hypothetical protein [Erythrobacter sp. THAF29]QFT78575.1 hypothetical protein FIU90_13580 [Erythrobacter sp. THAF29]
MSWVSIALIAFVCMWIYERGRVQRLRREKRALIERVEQVESVAAPATVEQDEIDSAELKELRERVQVLERIATDENSSEARKAQRIAREIESLRGDIARRSSEKTEDVSE